MGVRVRAWEREREDVHGQWRGSVQRGGGGGGHRPGRVCAGSGEGRGACMGMRVRVWEREREREEDMHGQWRGRAQRGERGHGREREGVHRQ